MMYDYMQLTLNQTLILILTLRMLLINITQYLHI